MEWRRCTSSTLTIRGRGKADEYLCKCTTLRLRLRCSCRRGSRRSRALASGPQAAPSAASCGARGRRVLLARQAARQLACSRQAATRSPAASRCCSAGASTGAAGRGVHGGQNGHAQALRPFSSQPIALGRRAIPLVGRLKWGSGTRRGLPNGAALRGALGYMIISTALALKMGKRPNPLD